MAQIGSRANRVWSNHTVVGILRIDRAAEFGRIHAIRPKSLQGVARNLVEFVPKSVEFGRSRSKFDRNRAELGPIRSRCRDRSKFGRVRAEFGPARPKYWRQHSARSWPDLARMRPSRDRVRFALFAPDSIVFGRSMHRSPTIARFLQSPFARGRTCAILMRAARTGGSCCARRGQEGRDLVRRARDRRPLGAGRRPEARWIRGSPAAGGVFQR